MHAISGMRERFVGRVEEEKEVVGRRRRGRVGWRVTFLNVEGYSSPLSLPTWGGVLFWGRVGSGLNKLETENE